MNFDQFARQLDAAVKAEVQEVLKNGATLEDVGSDIYHCHHFELEEMRRSWDIDSANLPKEVTLAVLYNAVAQQIFGNDIDKLSEKTQFGVKQITCWAIQKTIPESPRTAQIMENRRAMMASLEF